MEKLPAHFLIVKLNFRTFGETQLEIYFFRGAVQINKVQPNRLVTRFTAEADDMVHHGRTEPPALVRSSHPESMNNRYLLRLCLHPPGDLFVAIVFAVYCLFQKETLARQGRKILYAFTKERFADRVIYILRLSNSTFSNFLSEMFLQSYEKLLIQRNRHIRLSRLDIRRTVALDRRGV